MKKFILIISLSILSFLSACSGSGIKPQPFIPSASHINDEALTLGDIPELVKQTPILPAPGPAIELEKYTVVVNEVSVKELLFALARDAQINVDIHSEIDGAVTMNAIDQTLPQILDRIVRQVDLRYELSAGNLYIQPDDPFFRTYTIDYVNLSRGTSSTNTVSTQISSTSSGATGSSGGSGNNSTTNVSTESTHHFWSTLVSNISALLGGKVTRATGKKAGSKRISTTDAVIPNPESGILTVNATTAQHEQIKSFIDRVLVSAKRQVLIQITIVEVELNNRYQAGVDWSFVNQNLRSGISFVSKTLAGTSLAPAALSSFVISAVDNPVSKAQNLTATVSLLSEFGNTRILSSPQIMVLNNQTALLKVVENIVYFEVDAESAPATRIDAEPGQPVIDTTAKTVPVGIVMSVTPQISADGIISLNIRPTVSRVASFVNDPNPELAKQNTTNPVPQIAVREMESILRLTDGQIGVLGGLMQDETKDSDAGLPGIKYLGIIGNLFKSESAQHKKTELIIFLKPTVISDPSLEGDLSSYKRYLDSYNAATKQAVETESK